MPSKSPVPILQRLPHLRTVELESPTAGGTGAHFQVVMSALCCAPPAERSSNRIDRVGSPEVSELLYRAIAPGRRLILINLGYVLFIPTPPFLAVVRTDLCLLK